MPEEKIHEIRRYTSEDTSPQQLKRIIQEGWPADQSSLPPLLTPYFSVRDDLAGTDGLIFCGEQLVIPKGMRAVAKKISIADIKEVKPACATQGKMSFGQA